MPHGNRTRTLEVLPFLISVWCSKAARVRAQRSERIPAPGATGARAAATPLRGCGCRGGSVGQPNVQKEKSEIPLDTYGIPNKHKITKQNNNKKQNGGFLLV